MADVSLDVILKMQDGITGTLDKVNSQLGKLNDTTKSSAPSWLSMASAVAAGEAALQGLETIGHEVIGFLTDSVSAAEKEQNAMAQITNEISNLGAKAPITGDAAEQLAEKIAMTTTSSKGAALAAEQILLKFDKITKTTFPQAIQVSEDLAARLGVDLPTASNTLGRALEKPSTAMRTLLAAGITFNAEQTKIMQTATKTGDVMQADNMILTALSKNLSGASLAAASTFSGKMTILNNDFEMFKEKVGMAVITALTPFINKLMAWVQTDQAKKLIEDITNRVTQLITAMANWVKDVAIPWITQHWPAIKSAIQSTWDTLAWIITNKAILVGTFAAIGIAVWGMLAPVIAAEAPLLAIVAALTAIGYLSSHNSNNTSVVGTSQSIAKGAATGSLGGSKSVLSGLKASGGSVMSGGSYIVGEKGPELFTPSSSGNITPNNKLGGQSVSVNIYGNVSTAGGTKDIESLAKRIGSILQNAAYNV